MLSYKTIRPDTLELLKHLMAEPLFAKTRLVGGTALALQFGHRSSIDLDLFGTIEESTDLTTEALERIGQTVPGKCTEHIKTYRVLRNYCRIRFSRHTAAYTDSDRIH